MENSELTLDQLKSIIKGRTQVSGTEGYHEVRVSSIGFTKDGSRAIVNLKAMTPWHTQEALRLANEGDMQGAANCQLSYSVPVEGNYYIPQKNEKVKITLNHFNVKDEDGEPTDEIGTGVESLIACGVSKGKAIDVDALFADFEEAKPAKKGRAVKA